MKKYTLFLFVSAFILGLFISNVSFVSAAARADSMTKVDVVTISKEVTKLPLSSAEILVRLERVIRNNTTTALTPADSPAFDFDMNGDHRVNTSDQLKMRHLGEMSEIDFQAVKTKMLSAIQKRIRSAVGSPLYDSMIDLDNNGTINIFDFLRARNAMDSTR